jgi:hypothetical protein
MADKNNIALTEEVSVVNAAGTTTILTLDVASDIGPGSYFEVEAFGYIEEGLDVTFEVNGTGEQIGNTISGFFHLSGSIDFYASANATGELSLAGVNEDSGAWVFQVPNPITVSANTLTLEAVTGATGILVVTGAAIKQLI